MNLSASLFIKLLSLAVVGWAVLSTPWLTVKNAGWVPWLVLVLLILLDAYGTDSKPAAWSQWSAGLLRMQGPSMLPYYAALFVFLAFGPSQVRHFAPQSALGISVPSSLPNKFGGPSALPTQHSGPNAPPVRPAGFPGNSPSSRPSTFKPAAPGQPEASATSASPIPSKFARNPTPAQSPTQSLPPSATQSAQPPAKALPTSTPPAQGNIAPTSSARPPTTPAK